MVYDNLKRALEHVIPFKGQHVQEVRQTILDNGDVLRHEGPNDSPFEKAAKKCAPLVPPPTFTELINAGEKPKVLGGIGNVSVLDDAQFAQAWLARFNAAAGAPEPAPEPAPELAPEPAAE